jgi:hypothetical protein
MIEHLPSMCKALSSNPSTAKTQTKYRQAHTHTQACARHGRLKAFLLTHLIIPALVTVN